MARSLKYVLPEEVAQLTQRLGERIRAARIHRRLRQSDVAAQAGLSLTTIRAIEQGELTTGIGAVFQVLWVLGISREIELLADPGLDREGLALSLDAETKRVFVPRSVDDDF